jgi:hypothetical protein
MGAQPRKETTRQGPARLDTAKTPAMQSGIADHVWKLEELLQSA